MQENKPPEDDKTGAPRKTTKNAADRGISTKTYIANKNRVFAWRSRYEYLSARPSNGALNRVSTGLETTSDQLRRDQPAAAVAGAEASRVSTTKPASTGPICNARAWWSKWAVTFSPGQKSVTFSIRPRQDRSPPAPAVLASLARNMAASPLSRTRPRSNTFRTSATAKSGSGAPERGSAICHSSRNKPTRE